MESRVYNAGLCGKIMTAEEAARLIRPGMTVAFGGFTSAGYPKAIPTELAKRREAGEDLRLTMLAGSQLRQTEELLGDAVARRAPIIESKGMRARANSGKLRYVEQQIHKSIRLLRTNAFGKIDVAVVEALMITEDNGIVPTSSVCYLPHFLELADKVIIEINTHIPQELRGYHDIFMPGIWPERVPIPLTAVNQRVGQEFVRVDADKIAAVVMTCEPDEINPSAATTPVTDKIAGHLLEFLAKEYASGLPPIQTGIGAMPRSILASLEKSDFTGLRFYCGALFDAHLKLLLSGKAEAMSASSVELTDDMLQVLASERYLKDRLVLRNTDMLNEAEVLLRLGVLALNTALEIDIYGNVNASHICGTRVVNGLGGIAQFAQNAGLSVLLIPSSSKEGRISSIVPMASHVDLSEHDVDVIITEHGVADLRGKDDLERAEAIIGSCAAPEYKEALGLYLENAKRKFGGHHPQDMAEAAKWHTNLLETGTMVTK